MLEESATRQRDFNRCYNKIVKLYKLQGKKPSCSTIIIETVTKEAPSYYITFNHARRLLSQYRRNKLPKNFRKLRRDMVCEIAQKVDRIMHMHQSFSESDALTIVLSRCKASRFFITPVSARRLISNSN